MQTLLVAVSFALQAAAQSGDGLRIDWSRVAERDADLAAVRSEYVAAVNARDAGGASALYAPDALALFGEAQILRGAAALGGRLESGFDRPARTVTLVPRRFSTSEDIAWETGTFTSVSSNEEAPAVEGAYVTVYSRGADRRWRIAMEVRTSAGGAAEAVW